MGMEMLLQHWLKQQLQIAQEEEAWIQSTQEEFKFMAAVDAYKENERVKANCILENNLQQASTSGTQSNKAHVNDSDRSAEIKLLQARLVDQNGKCNDTPCVSDTLNPLPQKLENENVELEFQVSEQKATTKGTSVNTLFCKQSILGKPPSSRSKLYTLTPSLKSSILPKVDKTNALSKPVTSNLAPSSRESKGVQTINVIAPRIFRTNPSKTSRVDNVFPNKPIKASVRTKPITVSQPHVITKNDVNSKTNGFSPKDVKSTTRTRRPLPRNNPKMIRSLLSLKVVGP
uniref:Uncharacterized protein n=1 Tax=Tanacetum cinerariifolium TaxID=118510 RepID=A0A6L2M8N9_TANCI|nr:hypothetical protein [Tanacetum cinerariifolium]